MLLITDPVFLGHQVPPGHPERPERLTALLRHWQANGNLDNVRQQAAEPARRIDLARVHSPAHLDHLDRVRPHAEFAFIDADTALSPGSLEAASCAAGAVVSAAQALLEGQEQRVFCAVRPPGHHAEREQAMGFCLINSIAVGAATALCHKDIDRVAILDFDVHHGNGSVDIFRDDPRVMVCSSFQHPFYPHRQINVRADHLIYTPLPAGTGSAAFRLAVERDWLPALARHRPQLLFVSAGFDAHAADPLASLQLQTDDFRWVTQLIVDLSQRYCHGRVASVLEGGYDLPALCDSATAHLDALKG